MLIYSLSALLRNLEGLNDATLTVYGDSNLVIRQMRGEIEVNNKLQVY